MRPEPSGAEPAGRATASTAALAYRLSDIPRWVEMRDLLLSGTGEIFGLREEPELSLAIRDPDTQSVFVVGTPEAEAIRAAVAPNEFGGDVIAPPEHTDWVARALPEYAHSRAILHLLPDGAALPRVPDGEVGWLDAAAITTLPIPPDLLRELQVGAEGSPVAASFEDGRPVAFCYAGAETETLWDISIDTLEQHRRRGHATRCVAHLIRHMDTRGLRPVWCALVQNPASWRLAHKLGFEAVDALSIFEPPGKYQES